VIESLVRVDPLTALVVVMGDTVPVIQVTALDSSGVAVSLAGMTISCEVFDRVLATVVSLDPEIEPDSETGVIRVPWVAPFTDTEQRAGSAFKFVDGDDIRTLPGPPVSVYDPQALWCDPAIVHAMTGNKFTDSQVVTAILLAEDVVRAWVTRPITSPVSDRVRLAVALLASRALTSSAVSSGGVDAAPVVAETIGDYSVRYAYPAAVGSAMLIAVGSDIANLLAPWHPPAYDVFVGPAENAGPYPITADPGYADWWEWSAIE